MAEALPARRWAGRKNEPRLVWTTTQEYEDPVLAKWDNPILSPLFVESLDGRPGLARFAPRYARAGVPDPTEPTGNSIGTTPLPPATLVTHDYSGPLILKEAGLAAVTTPPVGVRNNIGIPKPLFLSLLRAAGREQGMAFPLVFLESCSSEIPPALVAWQREEPTVGVLYGSDVKGLEYRTLDYTAVLTSDARDPLAVLLDRALREKASEKPKVPFAGNKGL